MKRLVPIAIALALAAPPAAGAAPTEVTATYNVTKGGLLLARVMERYVRNGDAYAIQSTTRSQGVLKIFLDDSLTLTSEGRFGPGGLEPRLFQQKREGNHDRDIRATFDWAKGVMHSEFRGEARDVALPGGTQDRLSILYQFMNLASADERVEMHMANGRKVERYTYRRVEETSIRTPAGEFDAVRFERVVSEPGQSRAQIWLARDRHNLPVRIVFDDPKGLSLDQTLVELEVK